MDILRIEYIGFLGTICFLVSYTLVQLGKLDGNGVWYTALNAAGCVFMLVSLFGAWNAPVFLNNCFSLLVSLLGFRRHYKNKRREADIGETIEEPLKGV